MGANRRRKLWGTALVAGAALLSIVVLKTKHVSTFDKPLWLLSTKKNNPSPENPRLDMAYEILDVHLTLGMHKKEVEDLLGPPDYKDDILFSYYIGGSAGLFLKSRDSLICYFDAAERLREKKIVVRR